MQYRTAQSEEIVGSFRFHLTSLESFELAVDEMYRQLEHEGRSEALEELCPYFGVLWPGGRVLARWMTEHLAERLPGRRFLELGCGLALPSLVAAKLGADVTASDLHPHVPVFLARNLAANPATRLKFQRMDWRTRSRPTTRYDWIVASDVLYERSLAEPLARFLSSALAENGEALILDPNRSYWEDLLAAVARFGLAARSTYLAPRHEGDPSLSVLMRITRSSGR